MNHFSILLADLTPKDLMEAKLRAKSSAWTTEVAIVCGAIGILTLLLLVWAFFIRKRARRGRPRYQPPPSATQPARNRVSTNGNDLEMGAQENSIPREERRKKRRRRRAHRPRNPTLAETGGLPPVRPNEPPDFD
jgi:hypothetical protein